MPALLIEQLGYAYFLLKNEIHHLLYIYLLHKIHERSFSHHLQLHLLRAKTRRFISYLYKETKIFKPTWCGKSELHLTNVILVTFQSLNFHNIVQENFLSMSILSIFNFYYRIILFHFLQTFNSFYLKPLSHSCMVLMLLEL